MTREGRKYLENKLNETVKQAESTIRELSNEKKLLNNQLEKHQFISTKLLSSKFIPGFRYFLKLRKDFKRT